MNTISTETLLGAFKWRYATKQFDPSRQIDTATWSALEDVLVLSPSSFGLQPWRFLVVANKETREKLVSVSWGQRQVTDASHLVVFTVKHPLTPEDVRAHAERSAEVRGQKVEDFAGMEKMINGFIAKPAYPLDMKEWSTRQVYIALGNFMTAASLLGVDTCPMEGLDPAGYDKVLGLEGSGYFTVAACPAGYRAAGCKYAGMAKVRFDKKDVIKYLP